MATIKIQISKDDFERSLLAATSSHSEVFESVEPHFESAYLQIQQQILGEVGEAALETNERLRSAVTQAVCLSAFLDVVRHLDLVLTPTGFGVVANNEVSPASSSRVEALIEQCRVAYIKAEGLMFTWLVVTKGWGETEQARQCVSLLLFTYQQYTFQAKQQLTSQQWHDKMASLYEADATLRRLISDEQMDEFLEMERGAKERDEVSDQPPTANIRGNAIFKVRRLMFLLAEGLLTAYSSERARLLSFLDAHIAQFPIYANSSAYKANHFKYFKNEKSRPAYLFNA